jgi:hypothetical protein
MTWNCSRLLEVFAKRGWPNLAIILSCRVAPDAIQVKAEAVLSWSRQFVTRNASFRFVIQLTQLIGRDRERLVI